MGNISVSLPADGETIDVADYNTPINTIVNEINGDLDNSNLSSSAAIAGTKLASSALFDREVNDTSGNEVLQFAATASAVNELTITNAATGNGPTISATGDDTNVDINLVTKGSGKIKVNSVAIPTGDTGWLSCTATGNYTTNTDLKARVVGGVLYFQGSLIRNSGNIPTSSENAATLPATITAMLTRGVQGMASNAMRVDVTAAGVISTLSTASFPSGAARMDTFSGRID